MNLNIRQIAKIYFEKTWFNHLIFWLFLLVFLLIFDRADEPIGFVLIKELINIAFFAPLIYLNLYNLVPRYLEKGKFLQYFFFILILVLLLTPIKVVVSYLIHYPYPEQQEYLLNNQYLISIQLIFVSIASMIFALISNIFKHQLEKKELQEKSLTSELKFLKSQIDPHFFFNTLNSLYALTLKKSDHAPETVLKLSDIMRYMLYECNEKTVLLSKEVQYIQNYIDLEKIRHGNDLTITLTIEGELDKKRIMPLVFSPFIENCFKHGVKNSIDGGYISILLSVLNDQLYFEVENSKHGTETKANNELGGIGLSNVKRRLKLEYPKDHELNITETDKLYKIELTIKLNNDGI